MHCYFIDTKRDYEVMLQIGKLWGDKFGLMIKQQSITLLITFNEYSEYLLYCRAWSSYALQNTESFVFKQSRWMQKQESYNSAYCLASW